MGQTEIKCRNNGPIVVSGDFRFVDAQGGEFDLSGRTNIVLCRCGHSKNKPFCDGSHKDANFVSEVKATKLPPPKS